MRRLDRETWIAIACLGASVLCFGVVPVFLRSFTDAIDNWTANGVRYSVGALFWLPWVLVLSRRHTDEPRVVRGVWRAALPPTVINVMGQCGFAACPYFVSASTMGFGLRLAFLFAMLFGFLFVREERRLAGKPFFWAGAALCIGGVGLLFLPRLMAGHDGTSLVGLALLVWTAGCWGGYTVSVRRWMAGYPIRLAFGVISLYTVIPLLVLMALLGDVGALARLSAPRFGLVLVSGLIGVGFAHVLYYRSIHGLGPVVSSGVLMAAPLVTFAGAALALGERMRWLAFQGGVAILLGGVLLVLAKAQTIRQPVPEAEAAAKAMRPPSGA
jgi:drug/metabolite transporter (DMT)-like permease